MTSQRRLMIKTNAAFGVEIGVQIIDILPNKSQISDFLRYGSIGVFCGVFRRGKRLIGARNGVILPLEEYNPDRILGVFVRQCCGWRI
jgi:hypothetical protein